MEDELLLQGGDEGVLQHKESSDVTINTALRRKKHSMKVGTTDFRSNISADELKTKKKSHEEIDSSMVFNWFLTVGAQAKETLQHLLLDEGDSDHENEDLHSLKEQRSSDGKKHVIRNTNTSPTKSPSKYSKPASRYIYSNGVGKVRIHLISAQRVEVIDSAEGDHHAVISLEEFAHGQSYALTAADIQYAELRTKTVRSSATPVFDKKWTLGVPTYQSCLKIALIDSGDNSVVGVSKIPIYSMIMGKYGHSIDKKKKHRLIQEEIIPMRNPNDPTIVTGHFSVDISFEEDVQALFLAKIPKQARAPDEESLSVERLVKHIGRFQLLINLVGAIFSEYLDLMNWKDFIFTSTMLLVFVYTALKINAEYALCCPVFLALCLFTRAYYRRVSGTYEKETIGRMKNNNDPYRPIATLTMAVLETKYGKDPLLTNSKPIGNAESNPVSLASLWGLSLSSLRPHVIHQKPFIAILYRPMRGDFLKLKKNEVISENRTFLVGSIRGGDDSGPTIVTSRHSAHAPSDTRSKDAILHNLLMPWPKPPATEITQTVSIANAQDETAEDLAFVYPLLQPVWKNVIASHAQESIADLEKPAMSTDKKSSTVPEKQIPAKKNKVYVPWEENESEIILSFHHEKPSHGLIESMTSVVNDIGQVVIPLKSFLDESIKDSDKMVYYRRPSEDVVEICQWFPVIPTISEHTQAEYGDISILETGIIGSSFGRENISIGPARGQYDDSTLWVCVRAQLDIRHGKCAKDYVPTVEEAASSSALLDLLRETELKKSTISTLFSLRDTVEFVQNLMCNILNYIETIKNLLLWVSPNKTKPLYIIVVAAWVATVVVPGRYLILALGLYQFFFKFIPEPQNPVMGIKFGNLIQSIPNEDEIDSVYFWERKAHQESVEVNRQHKLKVSCLNLVFPLLWSGDVHVKWVTEQWERAHLLFHDRRLAWWNKESDIDEGQPCQGQLLLYGHAGVMQASLVDVRETGGDEDQIVVIFGRDCDGRPIKCAVLCEDSISCRKLEDLVRVACEKSVKSIN